MKCLKNRPLGMLLCMLLTSFLLVAALSPVPVEAQDVRWRPNPVHLDSALSYVGTQEFGNNTGPEIDLFLASVNLGPSNPYCAAYVSFILDAPVCIPFAPTVRSGLARKFKTKESIKASMVMRGLPIKPGTILVWEKGNTIYGHVGIVIEWDGACGKTVEANTSSGTYGSQRDGDGVWIRERCIEPGNFFRITAFTPVEYDYSDTCWNFFSNDFNCEQ